MYCTWDTYSTIPSKISSCAAHASRVRTLAGHLVTVELFANGVSLGKVKAADHFFYFDVPNTGETTLTAVAGNCRDESVIRKVEQMNPDYILKEKGAVLNWFDVTTREGYFSLNDTMGSIIKTFRGKVVLLTFAAGLMATMKKNQKSGKSGGMGSGIKLNANVMKMLDGFTVLRASTMVGMVGATVTKEQLLKMNRQLNRIKKPTQ